MTATVTIVPACITGLSMDQSTCNEIGSHLRALAIQAEQDYRNDLVQFSDMLAKAQSNAMLQKAPLVTIGITAQGAQWLMYAVQNAACALADEEPQRGDARREVFVSIKNALTQVGQPA